MLSTQIPPLKKQSSPENAPAFLEFTLHVSLLLQFHHFLGDHLQSGVSLLLQVNDDILVLQKWLTLSPTAKVSKGLAAVKAYENVIKSFATHQKKRRPQDFCVMGYAAFLGQYSLVSHMLEEGAPAHSLDFFGLAPLTRAAMAGHEATVEVLCLAGGVIDKNQPGVLKHSGVLEILLRHKKLEQRDIDVHFHPPVSQILTIVTKKFEITESDPNEANEHGFTLLMEAAAKGDLAMIQDLLRAGVKVNARNRYGSTALMWAVEKGRQEAVELLIKAGANLCLKNHEGQTAMHWAVHYGQTGLCPLLKKEGARQLYQLIQDAKPHDLGEIIVLQKKMGLSKREVVDFIIGIETDPLAKIKLLQKAVTQAPNNTLAAYIHQGQGWGMRAFLSQESTHAVYLIKSELYRLQQSLFVKTEVDTSPKLL